MQDGTSNAVSPGVRFSRHDMALAAERSKVATENRCKFRPALRQTLLQKL